jgi:hypothetical protein
VTYRGSVHDHTSVLNTQQFRPWRSHAARKMLPEPRIRQPDVVARAVVCASRRRRRPSCDVEQIEEPEQLERPDYLGSRVAGNHGRTAGTATTARRRRLQLASNTTLSGVRYGSVSSWPPYAIAGRRGRA